MKVSGVPKKGFLGHKGLGFTVQGSMYPYSIYLALKVPVLYGKYFKAKCLRYRCMDPYLEAQGT